MKVPLVKLILKTATRKHITRVMLTAANCGWPKLINLVGRAASGLGSIGDNTTHKTVIPSHYVDKYCYFFMFSNKFFLYVKPLRKKSSL